MQYQAMNTSDVSAGHVPRKGSDAPKKIAALIIGLLVVAGVVGALASTGDTRQVDKQVRLVTGLEAERDTAIRVDADGSVIGGIYYIAAKSSGRVFDVYGGRKTAGTKVIQWGIHCGKNQKFQLIRAGNGQVYVKNINSHMFLDVAGASKKAAAQLIQWTLHGGGNQRFKFVKQSDGSVKIEVEHSGMVLDVSGNSLTNGASIIQYPSHNKPNQRFLLIPA